ncbi:hypothetical protein [Crateriforma conspicua]|uniref:Uncharacterized protein n=1 Tax=Crateriforma conspicua TaxID=2527996 RepID=A0A5C5Y1U6_9PLAN|nr:hypothetical protein [Crateriforma conspicua]TWT69184.1 hypothetical protein Pan14r_14690 [Crateriforma conspicua]
MTTERRPQPNNAPGPATSAAIVQRARPLAAEPEPAEVSIGHSGALATGCLFTIASSLVTCLLLFVNGSLVMAILVMMMRFAPAWMQQQALMQFLLFALPVALVFLQWMMIDYVRTRLFDPARRRQNPSTSFDPSMQ